MTDKQSNDEECPHFYGIAVLENGMSRPIMKDIEIEEPVTMTVAFNYCPWCGGHFPTEQFGPVSIH